MINNTDAWKGLAGIAEAQAGTSLRDRFAADENRAEALTLEADGLVVDVSKHLIDADVVAGLVALAEEAGVPERIEAMFTGEHINSTEDRAVLHTCLLYTSPSPRDRG